MPEGRTTGLSKTHSFKTPEIHTARQARRPPGGGLARMEGHRTA